VSPQGIFLFPSVGEANALALVLPRRIFHGKNSYSGASMDQRDIVEALARVAKRESNSDSWVRPP
jgi:hypothetical protein